MVLFTRPLYKLHNLRGSFWPAAIGAMGLIVWQNPDAFKGAIDADAI